MRRSLAAIFLQFLRLLFPYKTQVVALPNSAGKASRFPKQLAAAEAQRRANFGRRVWATPTSDDLRSCAKSFVSTSSSKPSNRFQFLTSGRPPSDHKTVAAVWGCWPDLVVDSGDQGWSGQQRREVRGTPKRWGEMGNAGGGATAATVVRRRSAVVRRCCSLLERESPSLEREGVMKYLS